MRADTAENSGRAQAFDCQHPCGASAGMSKVICAEQLKKLLPLTFQTAYDGGIDHHSPELEEKLL